MLSSSAHAPDEPDCSRVASCSSPDDAGGLLIAGSADGAGLLMRRRQRTRIANDVPAVGSESLGKISEVPLS